MTTQEIEIRRGLNGVYLDTTEASFIDGAVGTLLYRGYNIHDLAEKSTFEEVAYLLLYGKLPTRQELDDLNATLVAARPIPDEIYRIIELVKDAHPMDVLRTAVSALSAFDPESNDKSPEAVRRQGLRITAKAATIVSAHHRIRNGQTPVAPSTTLNHAGNFLYMLRGEEPSSDEAHIMDVDFVLHAEHGANASAFATRVAASTQADFYGAIVSGIATLKGPAHGGAAESVMQMAIEIGEPERAAEYVKKTLERGGRIMGFGHRVYKAEDPRARHLRDRSQALGEQYGDPKWFQILMALMEEMKPFQSRGIFVNVDFFAGSIYHLLGIPDDLFISIFALGRIPGWTLQAIEQYSNNILIRPLLQYIGPKDLEYVPIDQRG
jgi:citrate synthase